ncbi:MAG TPA: 30S ribosomal protein S7, partial [Candidatus Omnitrophica bacterium]|nr:30S ribosomal protein S7 [Candidatus Omnitrophota bacterium]
MRRRRAEKRKISPDPLYNSYLVQKMINMIMWDGKKSVAENIVY